LPDWPSRPSDWRPACRRSGPSSERGSTSDYGFSTGWPLLGSHSSQQSGAGLKWAASRGTPAPSLRPRPPPPSRLDLGEDYLAPGEMS
jgi:hypothetical protein